MWKINHLSGVRNQANPKGQRSGNLKAFKGLCSDLSSVQRWPLRGQCLLCCLWGRKGESFVFWMLFNVVILEVFLHMK